MDFTNTTLMDDNRYEYRFGAESSGHYNINVRNINIRIPSRDNTELGHWWVQEQYADLMGTIVHEAIHRKVHQDHGDDIIGHGIEFQRECLAFGLDPFRESNHDKEATDFLYPMNETDYKKYRSDWGERVDPYTDTDTDAEWKLWEKHDATYNRKCPAYQKFLDYVGDMRLCNQTADEKATIDKKKAKCEARDAKAEKQESIATTNVEERLGINEEEYIARHLDEHYGSQTVWEDQPYDKSYKAISTASRAWNNLVKEEYMALYGETNRDTQYGRIAKTEPLFGKEVA